MKKVLLVTGSAREGNVSDKLAEQISKEVKNVDLKVVHIQDLNLPFFDAPISPKDPSFKIENEKVQAWSDMIEASDEVVFLVPEYNGHMSAIQKNAIDWLYKPWANKRVSAVGYGFGGATDSLAMFWNLMGRVDAVKSFEHKLVFSEDIQPDGEVVNKSKFEQIIKDIA